MVDAQAPPESEFPIRPAIQPSPRADLIYQVLVAEVAGKRDQLDVALEHYRKVTAVSNDPQIAERAALLALLMKDDAAALELTQRWRTLAPASAESRQALALALLRNGRIEEAAGHLEAVRLASSSKDKQQGFATVAALLGQAEDKQAALRVMQRLSDRQPRSVFGQYYRALLAAAAGDRDQALTSLKRTLALNPKLVQAHLLHARLLIEQGDRAAALSGL